MTPSPNPPRTLVRSLLSVALVGCMAVGAPAALAQSTAATIRGQVMVDSAPAAGARVTAINTATGLSRSVDVGANGSYNLAGLPPGTYRVQVDANGQSTSQTVTVAVGQTSTLNLGVGGEAETAVAGEATDLDTVQVTAQALTETKTSEIATYISTRQIEALPQASRNFLAFADIVPGVKFNTANDGSASLRSGAQQSAAVNVFVDGVGQKDYVLKGGVTGQDSSRGNPFPQLGIAEYKVITSNYKAEYDQLSSAAITAVTRSGTNEFEGSFFWDQTSSGWRAPRPDEIPDANNPDRRIVSSKEEQYGFSLGGPIVRDALHYFVTYEAKEYDSPRTITPGRRFQPDELPPRFRDAIDTSVSVPFKEDLYFGKLSWTPGESHLLELTLKRREEDELTNVGNGANTASYGTLKTGEETRADLRYQFSAQNWLNDAHITFEDTNFAPRPASLANGYRLFVPREGDEDINNPDMDLVLALGGGGDFQNKGQRGYSFQNDFTFFGFEGHTIKAGVKYKAIDITAFEQSPFSPQFSYDLLQDLDVPYFVQFTAPGDGQPTTVESSSKQLGLYIQDDWEATDRLTLNLGLRWDYERTPSYENHVTPESLVTRLRAYPNINNANVDYDIEDYISTGSNRSAFKGAWQPRLGFSYDLTGDERAVVFGGAGRSYNRNQFDTLSYEQYRLAFQRYQFYFDTPGHACNDPDRPREPCIPFDPSLFDAEALNALIVPGTNFGSEVFLINNDIKTPYSDQFSLGIRNAFPMFGAEWNSSATLLHVRSEDGLSIAIGNRRPDGTFFPPGVTLGNVPGGDLPGYQRFFLLDNGLRTRLNSLLLSLEKPYTRDSGWGVTFAYTYSEAKENRTGDLFNDVFDYRNIDDARFIGSVGVPRHRIVSTGIVDFLGFTASAKLTYESPTGNKGLDCFDGFDPGGCSNALYRTYYFSEQDFFQLDLSLQREWNTGTDLRFRIRGDVLNVTNQRNYTQFGNFRGVNREQNEDFGQRTGLDITGPTRSFKLSFGVDW